MGMFTNSLAARPLERITCTFISYCACILVHHTNKPPSGQERPNWQAGDLAYLGSGSAEWGNWPRAVLAVRSTGSHTLFELRAVKRGSRLGWLEADGQTRTNVKYITHAEEPGVIYWREATEKDLLANSGRVGRKQTTKADIMPHVPVDKTITKDALRSKVNQAGIALNRINGMIAELVNEGKLFEWLERRKGTNPLRLIARFAPPEPELLA